MKRLEKAEKIHAILDELYEDPPIPLDHKDPYTLLVSVLLSAQTTDKRVNLVTPELFRRAPTPRKMVKPPTGANPLPTSPLWDTENLLRRNKGRLNFLSAVWHRRGKLAHSSPSPASETPRRWRTGAPLSSGGP